MFICRQCRRNAGAILAKGWYGPLGQHQPRYSSQPVHQSRASTYTTAALAAQTRPEEALQVPQEDASDNKPSKDLDRAVNRALKHLEDPYHIALRVKQTLEKGRFDEALLLTQRASRNAKCTVSWNHLIDHQLRDQKLRTALRLYNDMKKRGQMPDVQTYTVIFRGCAHSKHPKVAVAEAVKLYHTLLGDERLKPNVIHLNAVLEVCARAGDLDSMFSLLKTANGTFRSPDNRTYTLILNALRNASERTAKASGLSVEDILKDQRETIQRAKIIWQEAAAKWRQGKIVVDEELVCAMGRVLLLGGRVDSRAAMALVEHIMKIPNPDNGPARITGDQVPSEEEPPASTDVVAVEQDLPKGSSSVAGPVPRNNTLSMILRCLNQTRETSRAPWYWDLFTKTYGVRPDADNFHELLRVLRRGRASAATAEMMTRIPPEFLAQRTFKIAMSVCVRDGLNENALDSATRILDHLLDSSVALDPQTLRLYLDVARAKRQRFLALEAAGDSNAARMAYGAQIVRGLDKLWRPMGQLREAMFPAGEGYDAGWPGGKPTGEQYNAQREVVALARKIIQAADLVVSQRMVDADVLKNLAPRRNQLNRFVCMFFDQREDREPKLPVKSKMPRRRLGRGDDDLDEAAFKPWS